MAGSITVAGKEKPLKRLRRDNVGFSLVELIIVIAIMAALVGVLAPQFVKYVESSRRAVDIQNATQIREAVMIEMASQGIADVGSVEIRINDDMDAGGVSFVGGSIAIDEIPRIQGNVANKGGYFYVEYDGTTGVCNVFNTQPGQANRFNLTSAEGAEDYRNFPN